MWGTYRGGDDEGLGLERRVFFHGRATAGGDRPATQNQTRVYFASEPNLDPSFSIDAGARRDGEVHAHMSPGEDA